MNCRHCKMRWKVEYEFCPTCDKNFGGAIYPNTSTPHEVAEAEKLIAYIRRAFERTRLGNGITIHEADLEGCYTDDSERSHARAKDDEVVWSDVPDWKIERFPSVMPFFDPEGYRFYIPAYMIWTLKNWRTTDLFIADSVIWSFGYKESAFEDGRRKAMSPVQLHAAYRFVKHFCDFSGDKEPRHAMETFWYNYATPPND